MGIYNINCGHCLQGNDSGAVGLGRREQDLTRLVGNKVMAKLKARGHAVTNCTVDSATSVNNALGSIVSKSDAVKADMFVSIHLNASTGAGHGTEVFTMGAKPLPQAVSILKNLTALGLTNRGIKDGSHLYVVRATKSPAMLVECCFIDNVADMKIFDAEKVATAIVNGLIGVAPIVKPVVKVNYCLEWQRYYNRITQTAKPLVEDGVYGVATQKAMDDMNKYIKL